jgi:hypothetical protein
MTDLVHDLGAILVLGMFACAFWSSTKAGGNHPSGIPSRLRESSSDDRTPLALQNQLRSMADGRAIS